LQDAMSRQAQAERERDARVTLASAEQDIARQVLAAAELYAKNPIALQLRQMNLLYEMNKERGTTVLIPTDMAASMGRLFGPINEEKLASSSAALTGHNNGGS